MLMTSIIDLMSIDECDTEVDKDKVSDVVDAALECGVLYPPPVLLKSYEDDDCYQVAVGVETVEAAKKLHRKDRQRFPDRILCFVVEAEQYSSMEEQLKSIAEGL